MRMHATHGRRRSSSMRWIAACSAVLLVGLLGIGLLHTTHVSADATRDCGPGVPLVKCNPTLANLPPREPPIPSALGQTYWPSTSPISCSNGFFDQATLNQLEQEFGTISCFRFTGGTQWVVAGDGMDFSSGDGPSAIGPMIAVEDCATIADAARTSCLDPGAHHAFGQFTVSYPPNTTPWPTRVVTTFGSRLIYIYDGICGPLNFDITDLRWYRGTMPEIDAILTNAGGTALSTLPALPGAEVLSHPLRPASTTTCGS
jgi:hypothetical protein